MGTSYIMAIVIRRTLCDGNRQIWDRKNRTWVIEGYDTEPEVRRYCEYKNHRGAEQAANHLWRNRLYDWDTTQTLEYGRLQVQVQR